MLDYIKEKCNYYMNEPIIAMINNQTENMRLQNGKILQFTQPEKINSLAESEFQVFSQWGEDGIIQWLIKHIPIKNETFIEFGVEDYEESNTKFLLMNNNWSGMIIDGNQSSINHVKDTVWYWKYDLKAIAAFITRDNVNELLQESGFDEDLGILRVDIDGNDYWVLNSIEYFRPRILICEYNAVFGYDRAVTIPYKEDFYRTDAHYSNLYWGASFRALEKEALRRGYTFVGTNSNANNVFFVRNDLIKYITYDLSAVKLPEQKYRESRNENGTLSLITGLTNKQHIIADMPIIDVDTNEEIRVSELIVNTSDVIETT